MTKRNNWINQGQSGKHKSRSPYLAPSPYHIPCGWNQGQYDEKYRSEGNDLFPLRCLIAGRSREELVGRVAVYERVNAIKGTDQRLPDVGYYIGSRKPCPNEHHQNGQRIEDA